MKRHGRHRDPTAERARTGGVTKAVRWLHREGLTVMFAIHVYGLSRKQVTTYFGIPPERVSEFEHSTLSFMRNHSWTTSRDELLDGPVPRSADLRALLRELGFDDIEAWTCEHCRLAVLPVRAPGALPNGGRPRRYCSNACRQAAYRARRAARTSDPTDGGRPAARTATPHDAAFISPLPCPPSHTRSTRSPS
ncbi:hypothetical protein [Kitasatospora sp. NPDC058046]|uniref:hypothetical protein n=1 Tax=Kitasatospora sp. NPDC058046 TaxID=3346312 RepID=UPI0036DB1120